MIKLHKIFWKIKQFRNWFEHRDETKNRSARVRIKQSRQLISSARNMFDISCIMSVDSTAYRLETFAILFNSVSTTFYLWFVQTTNLKTERNCNPSVINTYTKYETDWCHWKASFARKIRMKGTMVSVMAISARMKSNELFPLENLWYLDFTQNESCNHILRVNDIFVSNCAREKKPSQIT